VTKQIRLLIAILGLGVVAGWAPASKEAPPPAPQRTAVAPNGYWLGAELFGTPAGRRAAAEQLAEGLSAEHPARGSPPGITVGRVETVQDAVGWVSRFVFPRSIQPSSDEHALHEAATPSPGGELLQAHGVHLVALVVSGATPDLGLRQIRWPSRPAEALPKDLPWAPAALLPDRAPLFAAPAAAMPRAQDRYATIHRTGDLYVLGTVDRCTGERPERTCLRWLQVVTRDGVRFRGGYLPAFWVARRSDWLPTPATVPRAQILRSGVVEGRAQWLLVARADDGTLHRTTIEAPMRGDRFPSASLRVSGDVAFVTVEGQPEQQVVVTAAMDRRPD
jgi:hypothetical protein